MSTGLQGQKIMYTTLFMGKVCRKNPGFNKDKTDVMFRLTLYDFASFISLYVQVKVQKFLLKIKLWALLTEAWSPHVILSLSLPPSLLQAHPLDHRGSLHSLICLGFQDLNGKALCIFTPLGDWEGACGLHEQSTSLVLGLYWLSV